MAGPLGFFVKEVKTDPSKIYFTIEENVYRTLFGSDDDIQSIEKKLGPLLDDWVSTFDATSEISTQTPKSRILKEISKFTRPVLLTITVKPSTKARLIQEYPGELSLPVARIFQSHLFKRYAS